MREGGSSLRTPFHTFKILETQKIYIKMYKRTVKMIDIFNQVLGGRSDKRKEKGMHTSLASEDSYQKKSHTKAFSHTLSHFLPTMSPGGEYTSQSPLYGRRRNQVRNTYDLSAATLPNPVS